MKVIKKTFLSFLFTGLILGFLSGVSIAEKNQVKTEVKTETRLISGELGFVDNDYISVAYQEKDRQGEEFEMIFYLAKDLKLDHKKSLKDLKPGDQISIEYALITETTEGEEKIKRVAKRVSFIREKPTGLRSGY